MLGVGGRLGVQGFRAVVGATSVEDLLQAAEARTGLCEWGDDWFRGPLAAWVEDLHSDQRGVITIPKPVRHERREQNLAVFDLSLAHKETAQIAAINTGDLLILPPRPTMIGRLNSTREN